MALFGPDSTNDTTPDERATVQRRKGSKLEIDKDDANRAVRTTDFSRSLHVRHVCSMKMLINASDIHFSDLCWSARPAKNGGCQGEELEGRPAETLQRE